MYITHLFYLWGPVRLLLNVNIGLCSTSTLGDRKRTCRTISILWTCSMLCNDFLLLFSARLSSGGHYCWIRMEVPLRCSLESARNHSLSELWFNSCTHAMKNLSLMPGRIPEFLYILASSSSALIPAWKSLSPPAGGNVNWGQQLKGSKTQSTSHLQVLALSGSTSRVRFPFLLISKNRNMCQGLLFYCLKTVWGFLPCGSFTTSRSFPHAGESSGMMGLWWFSPSTCSWWCLNKQGTSISILFVS